MIRLTDYAGHATITNVKRFTLYIDGTAGEGKILKYILGIDQGGTKTAAALMGSDGKIYGVGYGRGAYFPTQGMEAAVALIAQAVKRATEQARIGMEDIEKTVAGVTGVDWQGDDERVSSALRKVIPYGEIQAYNDCVIALYGGTFRKCGTVICAGTGLNAALCKENGECFVFGDYLGEELQGAAALAQRGARVVFDAQLGLGKAEKLTELYLNFAGVESVNALLQKYMTDKAFRGQLRQLVPEVVALAEAGDGAAGALLREFAEELDRYVAAGLRKKGMITETMDIVLAGSVLKGRNNPLTKHLISKLQEDVPNAHILRAKYEPVAGACIMGMLQKAELTTEMERELSESAEKMSLLRE